MVDRPDSGGPYYAAAGVRSAGQCCWRARTPDRVEQDGAIHRSSQPAPARAILSLIIAFGRIVGIGRSGSRFQIDELGVGRRHVPGVGRLGGVYGLGFGRVFTSSSDPPGGIQLVDHRIVDG